MLDTWLKRIGSLISLRAQLAIALASVALLSTGLVGTIAYRSTVRVVQANALQAAGVVATSRHDALVLQLLQRRERAAEFLEATVAECEGKPRTPCYLDQLDDFYLTEGAVAAVLSDTRGDRVVMGKGGAAMIDVQLPGGALAIIQRDKDGRPLVVTRVDFGPTHLVLANETLDLERLFRQRYGLGSTGETFVTDAQGRFVTDPRYPAGSLIPKMDKPMADCVAGGSGEVLWRDYRGVEVIQGFRPAPELGGGCVMANVEASEAFAPARNFERRAEGVALWCAAVAVLLALLISYAVSRPLRQITLAAERLGRGEFDVVPPTALAPRELRDVEEALAHATVALGRATHEREELLRFQHQMLGILGHDLRNPLNAITLSAGLLQRSEEDPSRQRTVTRILSSALRMGSMVRDLLDVARARSPGGIPVHRVGADLCELCRDVVDELSAAHPGRRIDFQEAPGCGGYWDVERMKQVLSNLVGNAVEHSPPETPVRISAMGRDSEVVVEVHNLGEPIPPELVPKLFEAFRRGPKADQQRAAGLGLGLYIADQLVRTHGGRIEVDSAPELGTTFRVRLPRSPLEAAAPREVTAQVS